MDTNQNQIHVESLTTPTPINPWIEGGQSVEALLSMSNFPFESFATNPPPDLKSPPRIISLKGADGPANASKALIEGHNNNNISLNNKESQLSEIVNDSEDDEELCMVHVPSKRRHLDMFSPPDIVGSNRYFSSDESGDDSGCARTVGGYNLRPKKASGHLGPLKRQQQKDGKNKHPANPNKKKRLKGYSEESEQDKTMGVSDAGPSDNIVEEVVDVDCETENCLISDSQVLRLEQLNSQNLKDDNTRDESGSDNLSAILDPGVSQEELLAEIWNQPPSTVTGLVPISSQDPNSEMPAVSVDLCTQESQQDVTHSIAVTFTDNEMDEVDKGLIMEAESADRSLTESSIEDVLIIAPSTDESPHLSSSQGESPGISYQGKRTLDGLPRSDDFTLEQDCSQLTISDQNQSQYTSHVIPPDTPDQDHSMSNQDLTAIDSNPLLDDPDHLHHTIHVASDDRSQTIPARQRSPDYSPMRPDLSPPSSPDYDSLTPYHGHSISPHHSPIPCHSHSEPLPSSPHTNQSLQSPSLPDTSRAPWNAHSRSRYLSPDAHSLSRSPSPDDPLCLALELTSSRATPELLYIIPAQRLRDIKAYFMYSFMKNRM